MHKKFAILFMNIAKGKKDYVFRKTLKIYKFLYKKNTVKYFQRTIYIILLLKQNSAIRRKRAYIIQKKRKFNCLGIGIF